MTFVKVKGSEEVIVSLRNSLLVLEKPKKSPYV